MKSLSSQRTISVYWRAGTFGASLLPGKIKTMIHGRVVSFLILAGIFAAVHYFALMTSLYWYFWWFDSVMHFWGGILIGLGVHAICTFSRFRCQATFKMVLIALLVATGTWELFEWSSGLWDVETYVFDTAKDVILGFAGGLLAHAVLKDRYNKLI